MELNHLRSFVRTVECRSISGAARTLHYDQSTLSSHIQRLELSVGVRLLHRGRDGVRPTPEGSAVFVIASTMLELLDQMSPQRIATLLDEVASAEPGAQPVMGITHGHPPRVTASEGHVSEH